MGALRQSRSFNPDMPVSTGRSVSSSGYPSGVYVPTVNQGLPTLIVMIVVLAIIVLFCFWGAPAVRAFCRRKICCCCPMDEPNIDNGSTADGSSTPTIILLPYGRMLVVDRTVFAQLQADHTGIDFMELSANLIRAQRIQTEGSIPSILESDATSKGLSPASIDFLPPAYEEIFGAKNCDLPPSYSEISMMFRKMSGQDNDDANTCTVEEINENTDDKAQKDDDGQFSDNKSCLRTSSSAPAGGSNELYEDHHLNAREFSSLEDNVVERNAAKNQGTKFNLNVTVHESHNSGPNLSGYCESVPENNNRDVEVVIDGNCNPEPCNSVQHVQYSRTLNKSRIENVSEEFIDKESTV